MADVVKMTEAEWSAEGVKRFGEDRMKWAFKCPCCGHVATVGDYKKAGASSGAAGFSCIGRWTVAKRDAFETKKGLKGPCNYAGGGLFRLNPVHVAGPGGEPHQMFAFADGVPA